MLSRRALIGKAAVGAAAAFAVGAAGKAVASARPLSSTEDDAADDGDGRKAAPPPADPVAVSSPPPWALLKPLAAGSVLTHGWRLVDLSPVQDGACIVTLENGRGRAHRVHLCRNDGAPQGIVYTRRVDLVVMNEGYGDLPTEEGLAQAVADLAHVVAKNERRAEGCLAELLPHTERVRRFAAAGPLMDGKLR